MAAPSTETESEVLASVASSVEVVSDETKPQLRVKPWAAGDSNKPAETKKRKLNATSK